MPYEKMKLYVGTFLLLFLTVIALFSFYFFNKKGVFNKRYTYYVTTHSAISFNVGMPIKLSGFDIGTIDAITLQDEGNVKMEISVDEKYKKWITQESYLVLQKPLIGSAIVEFHKSKKSAPLEEYSSIKLLISDDINDTIARFKPVVDKMINIVSNIEKLTNEESNFSKSLQNLEAFSSKLANDDSLLTTISGDKRMSQTLINSLISLEKTLKNVEHISNDLNKDIVKPSHTTIETLNTILKDVQSKLERLDSTVDSVNMIKDQVEYTTVKSNEVIDKIDSVISESDSKMELP